MCFKATLQRARLLCKCVMLLIYVCVKEAQHALHTQPEIF